MVVVSEARGKRGKGGKVSRETRAERETRETREAREARGKETNREIFRSRHNNIEAWVEAHARDRLSVRLDGVPGLTVEVW
jgi:hypothetical protein